MDLPTEHTHEDLDDVHDDVIPNVTEKYLDMFTDWLDATDREYVDHPLQLLSVMILISMR